MAAEYPEAAIVDTADGGRAGVTGIVSVLAARRLDRRRAMPEATMPEKSDASFSGVGPT